MARQKGTLKISSNIEPNVAAPLDARTRVPDKADLTASGQFPYPYIGMETYVIAENKKYRLIADDPTVLANWEEVGSGSGLPTGGTQGQVLTKQSATDGDADWDDIPHDNTKANSSSLAPVETSTTSEHAYAVGDHLMLAGGRFLVTADIAVGDTLDVSTNIQAVNLEDETGLDANDFADIITPLPGKFVGGLNFSTEEQVVGTWIDGKPLYQKTIVDTIPSTSADGTYVTKQVGTASNINICWISQGFFIDAVTNEIYMMPFFSTNSGFQIKASVASNTRELIIANSFMRSNNSNCFITLCYTKTSDPTP